MLVLWTIVMWATTFGSMASVHLQRFLNGGWHHPAFTSQGTLSIRAFTDDFSFFRNTLLTLSASVHQHSDEPPTDGMVPPDASATIEPSKTYNTSTSFFENFGSFPSVKPDTTFTHSNPSGDVNSTSGLLLLIEFIALLASGTTCLRRNRNEEFNEIGELATVTSHMDFIFNNGIVPNGFDYMKHVQAEAGLRQDGLNPDRILSSIPIFGYRRRLQYEPANVRLDSTPSVPVESPSDEPVFLNTFRTNDDQNSTRTLADISSSEHLCNNNIGNVVEPNALLGHVSKDDDDERAVSDTSCQSTTDEQDKKVDAAQTKQTAMQASDATEELSVTTGHEVDTDLKSVVVVALVEEVHEPNVVSSPTIITGADHTGDAEEESDVFVYPADDHADLKTPTQKDYSLGSDQCAETPNVANGSDVVTQAIHREAPKSLSTDLMASLPPLPTTDEEVPTDIDDEPLKELKSVSFRLPSEPKSPPPSQIRPLGRAVTIHDIQTRETSTVESDDEESTALNPQVVSTGLEEPVFPSLNDPDVIYVADGEPKYALDSQANSRTISSILGGRIESCSSLMGAELVLSASSQNTVEVTSGGMDCGTWSSMHAPARRVYHNRITATSLGIPCPTDDHGQRDRADSHERRVTRKQQSQMKKGRRNDNKDPRAHSPTVPQGLEASMHAPPATDGEQGSSVDPPSRGRTATGRPFALGLSSSIHAPSPASPNNEAPTTPPRSAGLGLNASIHAPHHNTFLEPKASLRGDASRDRGLNSSMHAPHPYAVERDGGKVSGAGFRDGLSASMHAPPSSEKASKQHRSPPRQVNQLDSAARQRKASSYTALATGDSVSSLAEEPREFVKRGRGAGRSEADGLGRRGKNIPKAKLSNRSSHSSRSVH